MYVVAILKTMYSAVTLCVHVHIIAPACYSQVMVLCFAIFFGSITPHGLWSRPADYSTSSGTYQLIYGTAIIVKRTAYTYISGDNSRFKRLIDFLPIRKPLHKGKIVLCPFCGCSSSYTYDFVLSMYPTVHCSEIKVPPLNGGFPQLPDTSQQLVQGDLHAGAVQ